MMAAPAPALRGWLPTPVRGGQTKSSDSEDARYILYVTAAA